MPLYAWYILVVGVMILFAFPPLIAGDLLLEMERAFDWPFFDPARGGDPLLWQHLFWVFGHPEVYIIFLPAIAVVAMRSEEHTSELQSLMRISYAVFCLKKKTKTKR